MNYNVTALVSLFLLAIPHVSYGQDAKINDLLLKTLTTLGQLTEQNRHISRRIANLESQFKQFRDRTAKVGPNIESISKRLRVATATGRPEATAHCNKSEVLIAGGAFCYEHPDNHLRASFPQKGSWKGMCYSGAVGIGWQDRPVRAYAVCLRVSD